MRRRPLSHPPEPRADAEPARAVVRVRAQPRQRQLGAAAGGSRATRGGASAQHVSARLARAELRRRDLAQRDLDACFGEREAVDGLGEAAQLLERLPAVAAAIGRGRAPGRPPFMIASFDAVSFFISPIIAVMFSCIFIICWSRTSSFWSICVFINVASCCMTAGFKPPSPDDIVVVW